MNIRNSVVSALLLTACMTACAQVKMVEIVKLSESSAIESSAAFDKYITRGNFCSLILDQLMFSESMPGSFMLDLSLTFNSDIAQIRRLRVVFDDLIQVNKIGEPFSLKASGQYIATQIPLSGVTSIDATIRLIPLANAKYEEAYSLLTPVLNKPMYGVDIGAVFDKFANIATAGDSKSPLLFRATIPVPQNIIEAQRIDGKSAPTSVPLHNNKSFAIALEGSKEVSDPSVLGKAQNFLNGITTFATGKSVLPRSTSSFRGLVSLRFTKDLTQALPDQLLDQLKDLSDSADQAYTNDAVTTVNTKAADAIKSIDAIVRSKQIDSRAEFHLKNYVDIQRVWALHKRAVSEGDAVLVNSTQWRTLFADWYNKANLRGQPQLTQAYGISDLYPKGRVAKIFIPYSLTDDMTLELIQRQISIHQSLLKVGDMSKSEPS